MFYVIVVHPNLPDGYDDLDENALKAFFRDNPNADVEVTAERILTSEAADREEAQLVALLLAQESGHPVAIYDDSDVPDEIRESVSRSQESGKSAPATDTLNRMLVEHFFGGSSPQMN